MSSRLERAARFRLKPEVFRELMEDAEARIACDNDHSLQLLLEFYVRMHELAGDPIEEVK